MSVSTIGVIGAGVMGSGIAQLAAMKGINVILLDVNDKSLEEGLAAVEGRLGRLLAKGKMIPAEKKAAFRRIRGTTAYDSLKPSELIIEAATENYDLKTRIFKQVDPLVGADSIVASNTSSVSITKLASSMSHPQRFVGLHFFNPVPVMPLVEIVRGLATSDATHDAAAAFAAQLGKSAITVKSAPGFVVNRILLPMINEAFFVLAEGYASAEDIDKGMIFGCNHPIGPLALADMIGLDVLLSVMQNFTTSSRTRSTGRARSSRNWWLPAILVASRGAGCSATESFGRAVL
jgi:3-hydroxybutyryl-CoA dehydrogenase